MVVHFAETAKSKTTGCGLNASIRLTSKFWRQVTCGECRKKCTMPILRGPS